MNSMNNITEYEKKIESLQNEILSLQEDAQLNNAILLHQAKLASMGEMIGNIAHQWRQPLMELSSIMMSNEAKIKIENEIMHEDVLEMIEKSNNILKYMSGTIDDFRNFFSKDQQKSLFTVSQQLNGVLHIIANALRNKHIKLDIIVIENPKINGYASEFSQVLINIIVNARDMLVHRGIEEGRIELKVEKEANNCIVTIRDNAGGVMIEPKEQIFEPMFSAEKEDGTGIGLFMSKLIVESKMEGSIDVANDANGAIFTLCVPIE